MFAKKYLHISTLTARFSICKPLLLFLFISLDQELIKALHVLLVLSQLLLAVEAFDLIVELVH